MILEPTLKWYGFQSIIDPALVDQQLHYLVHHDDHEHVSVGGGEDGLAHTLTHTHTHTHTHTQALPTASLVYIVFPYAGPCYCCLTGYTPAVLFTRWFFAPCNVGKNRI